MPRLVSFGPDGSPPGRQHTERFKFFCNAFLLHRLAKCDEIWHNDVHWCIASLEGFWWTLVRFSGSRYLGNCLTKCYDWWNLAALAVWPISTYSMNLVNYGLEIPQYHAATFIGPSLMHLFVCQSLCQRNQQSLAAGVSWSLTSLFSTNMAISETKVWQQISHRRIVGMGWNSADW